MAAWANDMALIFFVYGAAFLFLGISILRQPKIRDGCRMAGFVWLLALFGLLHGSNEWLDFLRVIRGPDPALDGLRALVLPLSFLPLLEFGRRLMRPWLGPLGSPWMLLLPFGAVVGVALASGLSLEHTQTASRYFLALPGALLTGIGLVRYSREDETWIDSGRVRLALAASGAAFVCYALLAGLVVAPLDAPLARSLNTQWFQETAGLPVQFFRALCAIVAGLGFWKVLSAFERERERRLDGLVQAAIERDREHRMILDSTAEGILGLGADGRVTFSNPAASALLGYSAGQLAGADLHALVHVTADGSPLPREACGILGLLGSGGRFESRDETFRRADGGLFPVELCATAVPGTGSRLAGAVLSFRDITLRRERAAMLRIRSRALEAAHEGIMITDAGRPDHPLVYANPAFTAITGYGFEEVKGRSLSLLQGEERDQTGIVQLRELVRRGETGVVTLRNYRKDGTAFWNELHLAPVPDEGGRISHYVGVMNDISERIAFEKELELRAHRDELTGLANRVLLKVSLEQVIAQARRNEDVAAVLFVDLDNFKLINDALGHTVGDHLLKEVAHRLHRQVRESDIVSRLGGDEFAVVLARPELGEEAEEVAGRILEAVAKPIRVDGHELFVTASAGAALFPRDGADGEALLSKADAAMYRAKALGRNRFQYWSETMNERMGERLELLGQLRQAVERNELRLHYQPQVSLPDGRLCGVEALVRWQHPQLGLVPPMKFIPLAEESGLIEPIGEWVLFEACRQAAAWDAAGHAPLRMSVNLSARQFANPHLDRLVRSILDGSGLAPERLELELTETALMADPEQSLLRVEAIRKLKVQLALDDFGTGYSSLAYLKRFNFDRLKIDRSFVADVIRDPEDAAIVRTVIAMARMLDIQTVAEGAEQAETVSWLGRQGCDELQGYFVSRPLPAAELERAFLGRDRVEEVGALFGEEERRTVLLLDDEDNVLNALARTLRPHGWRVLATSDPDEAFALMARHAVQVVVSDQRMPAMSGTEFLGRVKDLYPDSIRIVLSGHSDLDSVIGAVNRGAVWKYLGKPWEDAELVRILQQAFERHEQDTACCRPA